MLIGSGTDVVASERWYDEIRRGRAFIRGVNLGASVGNTSHVQLFNPVGSAVTLIVRAWFASLGAAGLLNLLRYDTALTTLTGAGVNLLAGGAAGIGELRTLQGAGVGTTFASFRVLADTYLPAIAAWGFELGAGEGIQAAPDAVNTSVGCIYEWIEL